MPEDDPSRFHKCNAVAEQDRLVHIMCHEQDRFSVLFPELDPRRSHSVRRADALHVSAGKRQGQGKPRVYDRGVRSHRACRDLSADSSEKSAYRRRYRCDRLFRSAVLAGVYNAPWPRTSTYDTLTDVIVNGNWDNYKGKIATLGLVSGDDPELNYVQIPMGEGTQWSDSFTQDDYKAMVKDMFDGKITVSNDVSKVPSDFATVIAVEDQGAIKG